MEEWRTVKDFPNYQVSSLGRVRNIKFNKEMKLQSHRSGYLRVALCLDGKMYFKSVHRLVAKEFIINLDNKPEVDHIDRNKINNCVSNLRWVTSQENSLNKPLGSSGERYIIHNYRVSVPGYKKKYFTDLQEAINYRNSLLDIQSTSTDGAL